MKQNEYESIRSDVNQRGGILRKPQADKIPAWKREIQAATRAMKRDKKNAMKSGIKAAQKIARKMANESATRIAASEDHRADAVLFAAMCANL